MDVVSSAKDLVEWSIPVLDSVPVIRAILGIILVLFAPGFAWSLVFFKKVNKLERLVLSFGLSLAMVTLCVLALNIALNIPISGLNTVIIIVILIIIPLAIRYVPKYFKKRKSEPPEEETNQT